MTRGSVLRSSVNLFSSVGKLSGQFSRKGLAPVSSTRSPVDFLTPRRSSRSPSLVIDRLVYFRRDASIGAAARSGLVEKRARREGLVIGGGGRGRDRHGPCYCPKTKGHSSFDKYEGSCEDGKGRWVGVFVHTFVFFFPLSPFSFGTLNTRKVILSGGVGNARSFSVAGARATNTGPF